MSMETLKEFLHRVNIDGRDVDVYVDALDDGCAVCPPVRLTEKGHVKFDRILDMEMDGCTIVGANKDYDDFDRWELNGRGSGGRLMLAYDFLRALAGDCSDAKFKMWFENGEEL